MQYISNFKVTFACLLVTKKSVRTQHFLGEIKRVGYILNHMILRAQKNDNQIILVDKQYNFCVLKPLK